MLAPRQADTSATIAFTHDPPSAVETIALFRAAGLNAPLDEPERMQRMLDEAQYLQAARDGTLLVGLVRVLTDFAFNAFVADLAVLPEFQGRGIGSRLLAKATEPFAGVKFIVHPGHESDGFYAKAGFEPTTCMVRPRAVADAGKP
jgi:GNAT superfamily N-acetyltransferase